MKYRSEIDGLRAVAVIPVILFHAGFSTFSGGFVGVDVFFVISGYLITTIILSEMEEGTFSIVNFYERRARRILPALFLVMLISLPFSWLWLLPSDIKDFSQSLLAVSTFSSNIFFWRESGYWEVASEFKPLLHTWSLAVEEQYYILFPLFLMLMWHYRKRYILGSFMLIAGISLATAQWGSYNIPAATFYLLPTRIWELAIGSGIAFYFLYRKQTIRILISNKLVDEVLSLFGLLMIGYAIFAFDKQTPFPSLWALIPTIGTGLIILFSSAQTMVGRLLSTKPLVTVGLLSYSAYLWHQPLLAFARHRTLTEPSDITYAILASLSLPLAYLSWRFVEKPFRKKNKFNRSNIFSFAAFGSIFFFAIGIYGYNAEGFGNRIAMIPSTVEQSIKVNDAQCFDRAYAHREDSWLCHINDDTILNNTSSLPNFIAIGDSHLLSFLPALSLISEKNDLSGAYVGFSGCPPLVSVYSLRSDQDNRNCHELNKRIFEYVRKSQIKNIILVARWTYYTDGDYSGSGLNYIGLTPSDEKLKTRSRQAFNDALYETLHAYGEIGVSIHILLQVPMQEFDPFKIYSEVYRSHKFEWDLLENLSVSLDQHTQLNNFVDNIFYKALLDFPNYNISIYNPSGFLCDKNRCPIGTSNISYYYDDDHLSVDGARFVGNLLNFHLSSEHNIRPNE